MKFYLILFFLSVIIIICLYEAVLSFLRGEFGWTGEPQMKLSLLDSEHLWMWVIIAVDIALFTACYLLAE
ncbi:MAG: hypothetical protein IJB00_04660 [Akkermansia sp.]|nr:hypothetical protein [Akkermansia sp.]